MARKTKLAIPLVIERLSDGQVVQPEVFVDDFSGEAVPVVQQARPARELASAQSVMDTANRRREAEARAMLVRTGLVREEGRLVPPVQPGMRPVATIGGLAMYIARKPWRRL